MKTYAQHNKELYYRLIALWVVCEAFAGGIMHAAKIPFTGMIVSSLAVTCIILIAYYVPGKTNIIRATVTVAVFKLMLSPHSPPTAYIAVFFQGCLGYLLFCGRRHFTLSAIILSVLALVESAIQRLLVLVILYGNTFWHAVDIYIKKLLGGENRNYSFMIASGYVFLHAAAGIFVGIYAARLVKRSDKSRSQNALFLLSKNLSDVSEESNGKGKRKFRLLYIFLWLLLLLLFAQAYTDPMHAALPKNDAIRILFRVVLILLTWYLIFAPMIMKFIRLRLNSTRIKRQTEVNKIMQLLPGTKYIFKQSWLLSKSKKGIGRVKLFLKILLINILSEREEGQCTQNNHSVP